MKVVIKQITKFGIIGVSAVLVDGIVYYIVSDKLGINTSVSKATGFFIGTIYTYFLNKYWTWKHTEKSNKDMLLKFAVVYAVSMFFNVQINSFFQNYLPDDILRLSLDQASGDAKTFFSIKADKLVAFFMATVASAVINFLGQKFLVFKNVKLDPQDETKIEVS